MAKIHILRPETSRLIAAGEVIERPASALRELLDNSLDAQAGEIRVEIQKGGIDLVRVADDGIGMSREDLALSILDHATSKIESPEDLLTARTLGFRGEALASIAAVARIDIVTKDDASPSGWRLSKEPGRDPSVVPVAARRGTAVEARSFFETYPARRQFLKRAVSEAYQCRTVFVEKALAHPKVRFHWQSGEVQEHIEASGLKERLALLYPELSAAPLLERTWEFREGRAAFICADPSFHRRDRKYLQIFINRRRIPEWGLAGIVDYAFSEYLPGGMHPAAFLFLELDPKEVDFNIHPAKREARIRRLEDLKSSVLAELRSFFKAEFGSGPTDLSGKAGHASTAPGEFSWPASRREAFPPRSSEAAFWERLASESSAPGYGNPPMQEPRSVDRNDAAGSSSGRPFRLIGRGAGPFLIFEKEGALYLLDQHAAHERILFDRLMEADSPSQSLLVPTILEPESEEQERRLQSLLPELGRLGYGLRKEGEAYVVEEVPSFLGEKALPALVESLRGSEPGEAPAKRLAASMACRGAIKDGDSLDDAAAKDLIEKALALPFPRCPHGRPIWAVLDMETLYRMVGRLP